TRATLFPYTTLFRSGGVATFRREAQRLRRAAETASRGARGGVCVVGLRRRQARGQAGDLRRAAPRLPGTEAAVGRLRRLRPLVRAAADQRAPGVGRQLHRAGAGVPRTARAARRRPAGLLRGSAPARRLAEARTRARAGGAGTAGAASFGVDLDRAQPGGGGLTA